MAASLPPVSAKVIADIEGFVADFKRAENVTKRTVDNIDRELSSLGKKVKQKFTVGDMGKDVLRGAGLFGGFQIASTIADKIVDHFREQAQFATETEASMENQLKIAKQMIALSQTEEEQLENLKKERARAALQLKDALADTQTDEQRIKVNKLTEAYAQLSLEVAKVEVATEKENEVLHEKLILLNREIAQTGGRATSVGLSRADLTAGLEARKAQLEYLRTVGAREMGDPTPSSPERKIMQANELLDIQKRLGIIYAENARIGKEFGDIFGSSLEEAIVSGGKLSDVLRNLAQDILRLFVHETVSAPFAKMMSAAFTSVMGRASGGPVSGGHPYIVGEHGPELFVPGSSGGIVPNNKLGGSGASFNFTYNFATGVTRQEVAGLIPQMVEASKRAVVDAVSRGGSFRKSFA